VLVTSGTVAFGVVTFGVVFFFVVVFLEDFFVELVFVVDDFGAAARCVDAGTCIVAVDPSEFWMTTPLEAAPVEAVAAAAGAGGSALGCADFGGANGSWLLCLAFDGVAAVLSMVDTSF
jgi:hypothetical protein